MLLQFFSRIEGELSYFGKLCRSSLLQVGIILFRPILIIFSSTHHGYNQYNRKCDYLADFLYFLSTFKKIREIMFKGKEYFAKIKSCKLWFYTSIYIIYQVNLCDLLFQKTGNISMAVYLLHDSLVVKVTLLYKDIIE